ncbi:phosphate/phosphite/phosphonate ABC transporter substrate-binding protein [Sulfuriferula nivalis]|uniref:Phosphate/phosphite/phosphonate ABC transporter substrate-binding protein n=1 Tax=Sulfuriferula nivalis TaxID=2675298 RepID=A0A809SF84_9PROT|nr:phosphate/phosphite/phosphonate ABC transporter substrate-binding protein [Sulfuriferula nivalis]BBP02047.1 hypothetical protein SFSGTM_27550 [Sulfuriferula nivalis]
MLRNLGLCFILFSLMANSLAQEPLRFGVLNQRSVLLTAQLWNPILNYVTAKTGVPLVLKMGKTADETLVMTVRGEFDFVYSNHLFTPDRDKLGYHVIARFKNEGISGMVVTSIDSPYQKLIDLQGKVVAFPTPNGFSAYALPMDGLLRAGVHMQSVFVGNQEAALSNVQYGKAAAAGVNNIVYANYIQREKAKFRVLYQSPYYYDLPVMANPRVPASTVGAVQLALVSMGQDTEGQRILAAAQQLLHQSESVQFISANDSDYDNYRTFYRLQMQGGEE